MGLQAPEKTGQPQVIAAPRYGKGMIEQDFRFPSGEIKTFRLWWAPGGYPTIMFPLTDDGRIVATRQWRAAVAFSAPEECWVIELPGGNPKKGTNPSHEEVAAMELLEETGYCAKERRRLQPRGPWFEPSSLTHRFVPLLGTGCKKAREPEPEETELIEVITPTIAEWVGMIRQGEVEDAKSIAVTFLGLLHLGLLELKLPGGQEDD